MGETSTVKLHTFDLKPDTLPGPLFDMLTKYVHVPHEQIGRIRRVVVEVDMETGHGAVSLVLHPSE